MDNLCNQMWYTNEYLVGMTFFDSDLSPECKKETAKNFVTNKGADQSKARLMLQERRVIQQFSQKARISFVTTNTQEFFKSIGFRTSFLRQNPETWTLNEDYRQASATIRCLQVVNDPVVRGVALAERVNSILTRKEEQRQAAVQVIQSYIKR